MITSDTIELTILPNAPPMITPTAMSMALPRVANSLNSFSTLIEGPPLFSGFLLLLLFALSGKGLRRKLLMYRI
jgi:hypothetical protein